MGKQSDMFCSFLHQQHEDADAPLSRFREQKITSVNCLNAFFSVHLSRLYKRSRFGTSLRSLFRLERFFKYTITESCFVKTALRGKKRGYPVLNRFSFYLSVYGA